MNEKKVILKKNQIVFLLEHIKTAFIINKLLKVLNGGENHAAGDAPNRYEIHFSDKEIESILDELTYLLTNIGLDSDSNINDIGLIIEDHIDIFSTVLYNS